MYHSFLAGVKSWPAVQLVPTGETKVDHVSEVRLLFKGDAAPGSCPTIPF